MKRLILSLLVGVGVLLPSTSRAADGDPCRDPAASIALHDSMTAGTVIDAWCVILCDSLTANGSCAQFDLATVGRVDLIKFQLETETTCSAGTLSLTSRVTTTSTEFDIGATNTLVVGSGNTKTINVDQRTAPLNRYIEAVLASEAACATTGFEVHMIGYEIKR